MALVKVTKDDILSGEPETPDKCPVAIAMTRALKRDLSVGVDDWGCHDADDPVSLPLPIEAVDFIYKYDSLLPVEPFEFEVPDDYCKGT